MTITVSLGADGSLVGPAGYDEQHLTNKEAALLLAIALRKGGTMTKENILTALYGGMDEPELKIIDFFVCKVRKKLAAAGAPEAIETVRGRGYRWDKSTVLKTPDGSFMSMEVNEELAQRIEDLALAAECSVGELIHRIVTENLDEYEAEVWEC